MYENVNDIIGITILLDTNRYLDLFADFIFEEISKNRIPDDISDVEKSLKKFSEIRYYNIKLKYKTYPIEIQIKSNLLSSYTNLEHKLIYKNNKVSAVKRLNSEVIQAITPNLVAIENVIDTVEDSLNDAIFQEFICQRQAYIEALLDEKYGDHYNFISNYLETIDFILYRSFKGSLITARNLSEEASLDLSEYMEYIDSVTKGVKPLNTRGGSGENFLSDILIEFIKDFETLVRHFLIAEEFDGQVYKDIEQKSSVDIKEGHVELFIQLLKEEDFGRISIARKLFDFERNIKKSSYTNPIYEQLSDVLESYLLFLSDSGNLKMEYPLLKICMRGSFTEDDVSEDIENNLIEQGIHVDSSPLFQSIIATRRNEK
ncbi:hypothetical protein HCB29_16740 [Listeria booriae]|nr:hypothetical protein [Listeria booriae]MBC2164744.1 hypothetical protein [Listeria booriae]